MEETIPRPLCLACGKCLADKKASGQGYRPTCSQCRRKGHTYKPDRTPKRQVLEGKIVPHERPTCAECGKNPCMRQSLTRHGLKVDGTPYYRTICSSCNRRAAPKYNLYRGMWGKRRKLLLEDKHLTCSRCGFIPLDICQLEIDHIDGNKKNNADSNLQVLCANCHKLKTRLSYDYSYKNERKAREARARQ